MESKTMQQGKPPAHKVISGTGHQPAGQIVNPLPDGMVYRGPKRLGDIIDRVVKTDPYHLKDTQDKSEEYTKGYIDGKAEGFKEGIAWAKGR